MKARLGVPTRMSFALAANAGAVDACGISLGGRYVSHMSGTTSLLAGAVTNGGWLSTGLCALVLACFVAGAVATGACSDGAGALPRFRCVALLAVEAVLILTALASTGLPPSCGVARSGVLTLLPFAMGLQNSLSAEGLRHHPRTTHVTGALTSCGYHLGRGLRTGMACHDRRAIGRAALVFSGFLAGGLAARSAYQLVGALVLIGPAALAAILGVLLSRIALEPEE